MKLNPATHDSQLSTDPEQVAHGELQATKEEHS